MKIALGLEYCGTTYSGWQRQRHTDSIQQHVEEALSHVADHTVSVQCAGRTDAGVHAWHQVIHFETEVYREMHSWVLGGNVNLPKDISLLWAKNVSDEFNARFSAIGRGYRYIILNRRATARVLNRVRSGLWIWILEAIITSASTARATSGIRRRSGNCVRR